MGHRYTRALLYVMSSSLLQWLLLTPAHEYCDKNHPDIQNFRGLWLPVDKPIPVIDLIVAAAQALKHDIFCIKFEIRRCGDDDMGLYDDDEFQISSTTGKLVEPLQYSKERKTRWRTMGSHRHTQRRVGMGACFVWSTLQSYTISSSVYDTVERRNNNLFASASVNRLRLHHKFQRPLSLSLQFDFKSTVPPIGALPHGCSKRAAWRARKTHWEAQANPPISRVTMPASLDTALSLGTIRHRFVYPQALQILSAHLLDPSVAGLCTDLANLCARYCIDESNVKLMKSEFVDEYDRQLGSLYDMVSLFDESLDAPLLNYVCTNSALVVSVQL